MYDINKYNFYLQPLHTRSKKKISLFYFKYGSNRPHICPNPSAINAVVGNPNDFARVVFEIKNNVIANNVDIIIAGANGALLPFLNTMKKIPPT